MSKLICFLYTDTNSLHSIKNDEMVSKKNLYGVARLVSLNYIIGYRDSDNKFVEEKKERFIIKPKNICFNKKAVEIHNITQKIAEDKGKDIEVVLNKFKDDLKNVKIIVSHSTAFHIKAIQGECLRNCVRIFFNDYILVDLMNFYHVMSYPKLKDLTDFLFNKKYEDKKHKYNLTLIKKVFLELYSRYEKEIKSLES